MKDDYRIPSIVNIAIIVLVLGSIGIASIFLPKPTSSAVEKRELTAMPKLEPQALFSGKYTKQLEMHYADTFPAREAFVSFASFLDESKGVRFDDVRIHGDGQLNPPPPPPPSQSSAPILPNESSSEASSSSEQSSAVEPQAPTKGSEEGEKQGSTFIYKGRGFAMFGGSEAMGKWYADTINAYQDTLVDSGVQLYNIIVPTSIDFYLPEKYKNVSSPQKPNIDYIYSQLNPKIKAIDAYSSILPHKDEYVYFNTDHHWTVMGAYYTYEAFIKEAGFNPTPLSAFEKRTRPNFLGTLYGQTQDSSLKENPDFVDYYMPRKQHTAYRYIKDQPFTPYATTVMGEYASGAVSYSVFLHGDHPLVKIDTENKNGRKAMIIKESYGNAFAPFLVDHFEEIYVVDQRYFQLGLVNYIKENGITDLIFINNIFAANTPYHIEKIAGMMYQTWTPPLPPPLPEETPPEGESDSEGESESSETENGGDENIEG